MEEVVGEGDYRGLVGGDMADFVVADDVAAGDGDVEEDEDVPAGDGEVEAYDDVASVVAGDNDVVAADDDVAPPRLPRVYP